MAAYVLQHLEGNLEVITVDAVPPAQPSIFRLITPSAITKLAEVVVKATGVATPVTMTAEARFNFQRHITAA